MPERIQRRRTLGWRMPSNAIYVGRPSRYGNPWTIADAIAWDLPEAERREWLVKRYRTAITTMWWPDEVAEMLAALRGKDLCCWCPLVDVDGQPVPCHADVLLEMANQPAEAVTSG